MKRFFLAIALCSSLLIGLSFFLFPVADAAENPIAVLLNLPAPPPPSPHVSIKTDVATTDFDRQNPPPDDAPIEVLIEFWRSLDDNGLGNKTYPSEKVLDRLMAEMDRNPELSTELLKALPRSSRTADFVKDLYERTTGRDESQRDRKAALRRWLKYNTALFSNELERTASRVRDSNDYVTNHEDLISLARLDWDRANPIVSRLYANSAQKASQTAARWALYLHAIEIGSPSDTERYRDELKATVEDKSLSDGVRDLALDALSLEKDWSGRDEWYLSLMQDETLLELGTYTGLTTLMNASPDEKYIDRMIALLDSENINVRTAAARNLLTKLDTSRPQVIRALLPWLANPKWLRPNTSGREMIVQVLSKVKVPESVPALIAALDEKASVRRPANTNAAWDAARAANMMANAANTAARIVQQAANISTEESTQDMMISEFGYDSGFPLRYAAINALKVQQDSRAVPALRRVLGDVSQPYEYSMLIGALYDCGGFTAAEQVDALEQIAKAPADSIPSMTSNMATNAWSNFAYSVKSSGLPAVALIDRDGRMTSDVGQLLGIYLLQLTTVSDDVGRAVVDRIEALDKNDRTTADAMRKIVMRWDSPAIYALQLRDLKNDRADADSIVRLLALRKTLRETLNSEIFSTRTGSQTAHGISACLLEDPNDYEAILDGNNDEGKLALLACAKLIRAPLSVAKVASNLQSKNAILALAAERYLVSEDSADARRIVLSLHPNESRITGATIAFFFESFDIGPDALGQLFASVSPYHSQGNAFQFGMGDTGISEIENAIKDELQKSPELLGVYNWQENFVHIYKDRAVLSWRNDPARYRERVITKEEFDALKGLIAHFKADDLPPFLECQYCEPREFLMLGRNGGRRVYVKALTLPPFFAELDRMFADLRRPPATIKYWAAKTVPGLEVLFADDRLDAMAVWKDGNDLRLLTADLVKRAEIDQEIDVLAESEAESVSEDDEQMDDPEELRMDGTLSETRVDKEKARRQYENFAWFDFRDGSIGAATSQPNDVPFLPLKDDLSVPPLDMRWKALAGATEIRTDEKGLYKVTGGKLTKIRSGYYGGVVVTPDGRWAVATKVDEDAGQQLVRVNLVTNREFVIQPEDFPAFLPIAFVPSLNRVLLGPFEGYGIYRGDRSESRGDANFFSLLDPATGKLTTTELDLRPFAQQTFRPLQSTGTSYEYWVALPDEKETIVGIYNTRTFIMRPVLTLPEIRFNSMDMWIDAVESKLYFVYGGHLLRVPLKTGAGRTVSDRAPK